MIYRDGAPTNRTTSSSNDIPQRKMSNNGGEWHGGMEKWLKIMERQDVVVASQSGAATAILGSKSQFRITYLGNRMPKDARAVFELSAKTWADNFESTIPVRVAVDWSQLGQDTLGEANTAFNVDGERHEKLIDGVKYGSVMAAALTGKDFVDANQPHIHMRFDQSTPWHLDKNKDAPAGQWDLETVALHELTHGLFFSGAIDASRLRGTAEYQDGSPARFDRFITATAGGSWVRVCSPREKFGALTEAGLRFTNKGTNTNMSLFAPPQYQKGSSTYHLDDQRYRGDCERLGIKDEDCSDLMTPQLLDGYTQRRLGETTLSILRAMQSNSEGTSGGSCELGTGLAAPVDKGAGPDGLVSSRFNIPPWGIYTLAGVGALGVVAFLASLATCFRPSPRGRQGRNRRGRQQTPDEVI